MKRVGVLAIAILVGVSLLVAGCQMQGKGDAKPPNTNVLIAAETWVAGMVAGDLDLLNSITDAESTADRLLVMADDEGWIGLDPGKFTYQLLGDGIVGVNHPDHPEKNVSLEFWYNVSRSYVDKDLWWFRALHKQIEVGPTLLEDGDDVLQFTPQGLGPDRLEHDVGVLDRLNLHRNTGPGLIVHTRADTPYMRVDHLPVYLSNGAIIHRVYYDGDYRVSMDDYNADNRLGGKEFCQFYIDYEAPYPGIASNQIRPLFGGTLRAMESFPADIQDSRLADFKDVLAVKDSARYIEGFCIEPEVAEHVKELWLEFEQGIGPDDDMRYATLILPNPFYKE